MNETISTLCFWINKKISMLQGLHNGATFQILVICLRNKKKNIKDTCSMFSDKACANYNVHKLVSDANAFYRYDGDIKLRSR